MKNQTKVKTMRLKSELVKRVEVMAKKENRNFNNMVETILINAANSYNKTNLIAKH